jgi:UDPglucose--hexose-1-phosphate uridylyltransferase
VIRAWRDRLRFWRDDGRLAFALVFKNEGPAAGASVEHCHSQLIGISFVPPAVAEEIEAARPGCVFCGWIAAELGGPLHVAESNSFAVLCPPAPRFPGETWVLPKVHASAFETLTDADADELAAAVQDLLARIHRTFNGPDFNLIIKSAPFRHAGPYHWRIEVLPRTTSTAGWEWGTGLLINTLFPERAAELLRAAG